jgi:hypothetical protein
MKKTRELGFGAVLLLAAAGLAGAAERGEKAKPSGEREFTLGLVQKEVSIGMSQADLASALGSPSILSRDSQGRECWVYDKLATEARVKASGIGAGASGFGIVGSTLLLGMLNGYTRDEKVVSSQRTLTVVIRFDRDARVESFAFHASRF